MLVALRWRRAGKWNLFVGDRSALFSVTKGLWDALPGDVAKGACFPLESRLRRVLIELHRGWQEAIPAPVPSWRMDQVARPYAWNVQRRELDTDSMRWYCEVPYVRDGFVGVDVKSHQTGPPCPYPVIVRGNESIDTECDHARNKPRPPDVFIPTGGQFAFLVTKRAHGDKAGNRDRTPDAEGTGTPKV